MFANFASICFVPFLICSSSQTNLNSSLADTDLMETLVTETSARTTVSNQTILAPVTSSPLNTSNFEKSGMVNVSTAPNNFVENNTSFVSNAMHLNSSISTTLGSDAMSTEIANGTMNKQSILSSNASVTPSTFDVVEPVSLTHATSVITVPDVKNITISLESNTFSPSESTGLQLHTSTLESNLDLQTTQYSVTQPHKTVETSSYPFTEGITFATDSMTESATGNDDMKITTAENNHKTELSSFKGTTELNTGTLVVTTSKSALLSNKTSSSETALSSAMTSVTGNNNFTAIPIQATASSSLNTTDNSVRTISVSENSSYVAPPLSTIKEVQGTMNLPISTSPLTKLVLSSKLSVGSTSNYITLLNKSTPESKSRHRKPPGFLNATLPSMPGITFSIMDKLTNKTSTSRNPALSSSVKTSVTSAVTEITVVVTETTSTKIKIVVGTKYGPGKFIGLLSVIAFLLLLLICCVYRCRNRQKYKKIRNLEIYDQDDFLFSSKRKKGKYQSDRHGLLDDSSEDDLY